MRPDPRRTVLVVDDEPEICELVVEVLDELGLQALVTGAEALAPRTPGAETPLPAGTDFGPRWPEVTSRGDPPGAGR